MLIALLQNEWHCAPWVFVLMLERGLCSICAHKKIVRNKFLFQYMHMCSTKKQDELLNFMPAYNFHSQKHLQVRLVIASCCRYFYHDFVCALQECFCFEISCSTTELCIAQYMYYYYEGSEIRTQRSIDNIATVYSRSRVLLLHHLVSSVRQKPPDKFTPMVLLFRVILEARLPRFLFQRNLRNL